MGTADSWLRYGRGTNGKWYPVEPYSRFTLAVVAEGGRLTTYVNGLVDQSMEGDCDCVTCCWALAMAVSVAMRCTIVL